VTVEAHPPRTHKRSSKSVANPASALPMPGLSERAQRLLARSNRAFGVSLEPAGGGLARWAKTKASI